MYTPPKKKKNSALRTVGAIIRTIVIIALLGVMAVSIYNIWKINQVYVNENNIHNDVIQYKPTLPPNNKPDDKPINNSSVIDLEKRNSDVVGWLTVPDTAIDYPFVQSDDNDFYLHRDIDKNYLEAGTLFLDFRNKRDLSDFYSIIYGHHMNNGSMLGALKNFNEKSYFDSHQTGTIFLEHENKTVNFFAFMVIAADNRHIYGVLPSTDDEKTEFLEYIKQNSIYYRENNATSSSKLVTLSTCSYEFDEARMVLIGTI